MQATTCRISPPEHHFRLLSQVKAACVLLETVQILLLTPQLCPKKKKSLQGWLCFLSHQITMNRLFEENVPRQLNPTQLLVAVQIQNLAAVESLTEDAHAGVQQV